MDELSNIAKRLAVKPATKRDAYEAGRSAMLNDPNEVNCHFRYFASPALMAAWECGYRDEPFPEET